MVVDCGGEIDFAEDVEGVAVLVGGSDFAKVRGS